MKTLNDALIELVLYSDTAEIPINSLDKKYLPDNCNELDSEQLLRLEIAASIQAKLLSLLSSTDFIVLRMVNELSREEWKTVETDNWQNLQRAADGLSIIAAEISAYAGKRGADGCGDSGHDDAMKDSQKMRKRIRKTLGYSYP